MKPQRICSRNGCSLLIDYEKTYCVKHAVQENENYNKFIRNNTENKRYAEFYDSKQWRHLRKIHKIDNPLCVYCLEEGTIKETEIVHHKEEIKENFERRLDPANLESVCKIHHNQIHKGEKLF